MSDIENKFETIDKKLEKLPDEIIKKINETMELKIKLAKQELKNEFLAWLVPIILGLLFSCVGTIFNLIK